MTLLRDRLIVMLAAVSAAAASNSRATIHTADNRRLEDYVAAYKYNDISQYSIHYDMCQDIKMYDDEIAAQGDGTDPFAHRMFVAFRICPTNTCDECTGNFGRYVVDVQTYLEMTIQNRQATLEQMCQNCNYENGDTGICSSLCHEYNYMGDLGYVDASQYLDCQRLPAQENYNDDAAAAYDAEQQQDQGDYNNAEQQQQVQYYTGPKCVETKYGNRIIQIGLFSDENCYEPVEDSSLNVEDLVGYKLSYILFSNTNDSTERCLSCSENDYQNGNDRQDADDVNEMCEQIYDAAAKCETPTGLQGGFMRNNDEAGRYQNQAESEFYSCNFIQSIYWDSYDNRGEIKYQAVQDVYVRYVTDKQKIALGALFLVLGGMVLAIRYFNDKIKNITGVDGLAQGTFV